jgi:Zn-dependent protease with chaperone function
MENYRNNSFVYYINCKSAFFNSYRLDKINIKYVDMTLFMSMPLLAKRVEVLDSLVGCDLGNICATAGR